MTLQAITDVSLMLHVKAEGIAHADLQKHAAQSNISALVAEKARALLDSVGVPTPMSRGMYVTVRPSTVKPRSIACPPTRIHG